MRHHPAAPVPALFWAAGFSFSYSSLLQDVPYDPGLKFLFFGEEMSMLARMWTSGYDVFAPSVSVIFHLWSRDYRPSFSSDVRDYFDLRRRSLARVASLLGTSLWDEEASSEEVSLPKHEWSMTSHINCCGLHGTLSDRMRNPYLFDQCEAQTPASMDDKGEVGERYGLGSQRTLEAFCEHIGVDFAAKTIAEKALNGGVPSTHLLL